MNDYQDAFWVIDSYYDHDVYKGISLGDESKRVVVRDSRKHYLLFDKPVTVRVKHNIRDRAEGDVIIYGMDVILVSQALRNALESIEATGCEFLPAIVEFLSPRGPAEVPYWQLIVNGWGGIAPPESGVVKTEREESGIWRYSNPTNCAKLVDPDQYDKSDFFRVWPLPAFVLVTNRIKEMFQLFDTKNCRFRTLQESFAKPASRSLPGFGPVPLSLFFRPKRAQEVGASHGIDWFDYT